MSGTKGDMHTEFQSQACLKSLHGRRHPVSQIVKNVILRINLPATVIWSVPISSNANVFSSNCKMPSFPLSES